MIILLASADNLLEFLTGTKKAVCRLILSPLDLPASWEVDPIPGSLFTYLLPLAGWSIHHALTSLTGTVVTFGVLECRLYIWYILPIQDQDSPLWKYTMDEVEEEIELVDRRRNESPVSEKVKKCMFKSMVSHSDIDLDRVFYEENMSDQVAPR